MFNIVIIDVIRYIAELKITISKHNSKIFVVEKMKRRCSFLAAGNEFAMRRLVDWFRKKVDVRFAVELFCRNLKRKREKNTRLLERRGPGPRMRQRQGRKDGGKVLEVGNRTESLEVGGSGEEISFYGRVTNLRTRHCRVPADGRTMRLRNTMLHSGNLKAVLTTNLQPLIPLCAPLDPSPSESTNTHSFDTYHPAIADRITLPPLIPIVTFSFFCLYLPLQCSFVVVHSALRHESDDLQVHVDKFMNLAMYFRVMLENFRWSRNSDIESRDLISNSLDLLNGKYVRTIRIVIW